MAKIKYVFYSNKHKTLIIVPDDQIVHDLYYFKISIPNKKQIDDYKSNKSKDKNRKEILEFINNFKSVQDLENHIKKPISKLEYHIPLYDAYSRNLYLIYKDNVYSRVVRSEYRFPSNEFLDMIKKKIKSKEFNVDELDFKINKNETLASFSSIKYRKLKQKLTKERVVRKMKLMISFLSSFDLEILMMTYVKVFYFYANEIGKNITLCNRPSFNREFRHIKPYYSRNEIINLALNMGLIKSDDTYYTNEKLMELCKKIRVNDISEDTIVKHQNYIAKNDFVGMVEYYSIQGSYFINKYLRNIGDHMKNEAIEKQSKTMWKCVSGAPVFDKEYIVYRFVHDDSYLKHLKIGDIYQDTGFTSTTRDPFYRSKEYKFGFILLKIKLPPNMKGIALCVETFSSFPEEQELILPPNLKLKLESRDEKCNYYHIDDNYESQITRRYEFKVVGKAELKFPKYERMHEKSKLINFMKIDNSNTLSVEEKIRRFIDLHLDQNNQFITKIGKTGPVLTFMTEWYDSTGAYKPFYRAVVSNGFNIYSFNDGYIDISIEIGENDLGGYMYVNHYFKKNSFSPHKKIKDSDLVQFISELSYWFNTANVLVATIYVGCSSVAKDGVYLGGNYREDFYKYLKHKKKRFINEKDGVNPGFDYFQLDKLRGVSPSVILRDTDQDELYQIYKKIYLDLKFKDNLSDFYIWLTDVHCSYVNVLESKMGRLFKFDNPFDFDHYRLNVASILYNTGTVDVFPEHLQPLEEFDTSYQEISHTRAIRSRSTRVSNGNVMSVPGMNTRSFDNKNTYRL